jgi:tetratricopeptide (TPR) repeat protein
MIEGSKHLREAHTPMTSFMTRVICPAVLIALSIVTPVGAQDALELPEPYREPITRFSEALGPYSFKISSDNEEAQRFFDQGMQLMFAFAKVDAVRSFRESWKRDPDCAICYWGEAWAWGSYLNGPMRPPEAPHAYAAVQKALDFSEVHASARERAYIEALSVRYVEQFEVDKRRAQDEAYAESMRSLSEQYPDDLDAATLYGDALFLLEPRRGTRDINDPNVQRLHRVLEGVLARDINHPGACHLYIHATESTVAPEKAEACAEFLGNAIPGASHINHMPSHTWNEIGRWADGVVSNTKAWHSDQKAAYGEGIAIYPQHNLHMLLFAASMDGQGAVAIQAGKDYHKLTGSSMYHALTLLRFGRFDEVLGVTDRPEGEVEGGLWDFAQGYAHLREGDADFAEVYLNRVRKTAETSEAQLRFHSAETLLGVLVGILEGELHRHAGEMDAAVAAFERAVEVEDSLVYDEPEPLPFAARHWLGAALLELDRFAEAEQVYRQEIADHAHNGWSLFGLKTAIEAQGRTDPAVDADLDASWARSDTWIRSSRF